MTLPLYPLPGPTTLTRRSFLKGSASFVAAAFLFSRARGVISTAPRFSSYPFTLGIASGDPAPDGVVLWTRLAPRFRDPDGGMPAEPVAVDWMVAEDEALTKVVQRGTAIADPAWAHSVHVEVAGLQPDRWYWYQFKAAGEVSPKGRTRTMPAAGSLPDRLRFAFASCQKYEIGYYTAYQHMAHEDLDLMVHLGDYIYEKGDDKRAVRPHGLPLASTLDTYRARYAVYKTDPALQTVHAQIPWIVTWDDHEVANDYAGAISERPDAEPPDVFLRRRAAAYQAYYEHMPLRRSTLPSGPDMLLYRRLAFGRLASFHVLDTRQYRSDQIARGDAEPSPAMFDPGRTLMGDRQREWLFNGLDRSDAAWNVLAQQILMARVDFTPGPGETYALDKWEGYEFERRRLLGHLREHQTTNPVVLSGDIHNNWANEISADPEQPNAAPTTVEFVGTSITSSGDGSIPAEQIAATCRENPFVKFHNDERGYVRCEVTPQAWRTDFRTVAYVTKPNAPLTTPASFVVESGRPRLQSV